MSAWRSRRAAPPTAYSPPGGKSGSSFIRVLRSPRLRRLIRLTAIEIDGLIESLLLDAELTPGRLAVHVITREPSDNMFLACAVEGRADYIVSGDQDLLTLESHQGIPIVTAAEFLRILAQTR